MLSEKILSKNNQNKRVEPALLKTFSLISLNILLSTSLSLLSFVFSAYAHTDALNPESKSKLNQTLSELFRCQKNLNLLMLPYEERAHLVHQAQSQTQRDQDFLQRIQNGEEIPETSLGKTTDFQRRDPFGAVEVIPAYRNGDLGFYAIRGEKSYFYKIPTHSQVSGEKFPSDAYSLVLTVPSELKLPTPANHYPTFRAKRNAKKYLKLRRTLDDYTGTAHLHFKLEGNPPSHFVPKSLYILTDSNQKGWELSWFGNLKGPTFWGKAQADSFQGELAEDSAAIEALADRISAFLAGTEPPLEQDFLRVALLDVELHLGYNPDKVTPFSAFNITQRLAWEWKRARFHENKTSLVYYSDLPPAIGNKLALPTLALLKDCESIDHPKVQAALSKAKENLGVFFKSVHYYLP